VNGGNLLRKLAAHAEADEHKTLGSGGIGTGEHVRGQSIQRVAFCGLVRTAVPTLAWRDDLQAFQIEMAHQIAPVGRRTAPAVEEHDI
jgi:hypothetical protein